MFPIIGFTFIHVFSNSADSCLKLKSIVESVI